ncbi:MAG: hypothetical protein QNJ91_04635 [Gammaproteobacteria bacterium]|nr:hypothetical protein [Gammaproteobacteria bacterium]
MTPLIWLLAALFLPLFPLSMLFNALLARVTHVWLRGLLLLVWPQVGLALLATTSQPLPDLVLPWATLTAALYALRALAMRDLGGWSGFIATSSWALLWIALWAGRDHAVVALYALGFSLPLLLLAQLGACLERRFGAAYTGVYGGLAQSLPRFSAILVLVVLAVVATPLFPAFASMLGMTIAIVPGSPATAVGMLLVWLLWTWAGARLLQGLIVGTADAHGGGDLGRAATWSYSALLGALVVAGVVSIGWQL